jgi:hypothetical protein
MPESRQWWSANKAEQKHSLEEAIEWHLDHYGDELTNRQKLLLSQTIGHTLRGLFGLARQDIYDLQLPESAWSPTAAVTQEMVVGITNVSLREWLRALRRSEVQEQPVFR